METSNDRKCKPNLKMLPNSERQPLKEAKSMGPVHPNDEIEVTLFVRRPSRSSLLKNQGKSLFNRISRERFQALYHMYQEDFYEIQSFAEVHHLKIKETHAVAGTIKLSGTAQAVNQAFGVSLEEFAHPEIKYRGHHGPVYIPEDLDGIIEAVLGLDNRPQLHPHFQILEEDDHTRSEMSASFFTPNQLAKLYNFPLSRRSSGTTPCIGLIELGGGYSSQDLQNYFSSLGIPKPTMVDVSVDGGQNQPTGNPNGPDGEVTLDIEVAGAVLPGCKIVVYFTSNTDAGFLNAIQKAIHDTKNKPSVISISWGSAETNWTKQAMQAMDRAFQDAAALGVTICCAAGDRGSSDGVDDGKVHVDFPASSPHVLACGGTQLTASSGNIEREAAWHEGPGSSSGGGISDVFALPSWQHSVNVPTSANPGGYTGRGVPDVAADADPKTGYQVLVDGQTTVVGGTSAVAPLWAGLIALMNQELGQTVGFINPFLYQSNVMKQGFNDITEGTNDTSWIPDAYQAGPGWDACTGLGTPKGDQLLNALQEELSSKK